MYTPIAYPALPLNVPPPASRWTMRVATGLPVVCTAQGAASEGNCPLGYARYLVRHRGGRKLPGVAGLRPAWPRLREWASAGRCGYPTGVRCAAAATGGAPSTWLPALLGGALTRVSCSHFRRHATVTALAQ